MTQNDYPTHSMQRQQADTVAFQPHRPSAHPNTNYLELGKFGAIVGFCGAGAANLRRMQRDEISGSEVLFDSLRTAVAAGLATATASFVANQFRSSSLSLAATLATGTAVMYVLNTESREKTDEQ